MTPEKDRELVAAHPKVLSKRGDDPRMTAIGRGINCGDGWYSVLDDFMEKVEFLLSHVDGFTVGVGEIKSKDGRLVIYWRLEPSRTTYDEYSLVMLNGMIQDLTTAAAERATNVCERCGHTIRIPGETGDHKCPE